MPTNADLVETNADFVETNADFVETNADFARFNADFARFNADGVRNSCVDDIKAGTQAHRKRCGRQREPRTHL